LTKEFRLILVASDNIDADFKGYFDFATIGDAFKEIVPQYFSALQPRLKNVANPPGLYIRYSFKEYFAHYRTFSSLHGTLLPTQRLKASSTAITMWWS